MGEKGDAMKTIRIFLLLLNGTCAVMAILRLIEFTNGAVPASWDIGFYMVATVVFFGKCFIDLLVKEDGL
jgi:hypothetical protein